MFLRATTRNKNGKRHRYFSVVENRRVGRGRTVQRQVLYLGEINDSQQVAWHKTLEVFDEDRRAYRTLSLFPDDRALPPQALEAVAVKISELKLCRPRAFGDCWLGCRLWEELGLTAFWAGRLAEPRARVPWVKVLQLLVINRLIAPGSEFHLHRQWFLASAMDELLAVDYQVAAKDRLYRCLDRLLPHKDDLCRHLTERWKTLFQAQFDVLLYDLTSTYFEGLCAEIPKAKHGYSRDGRPDCRQVVIALVVTPDGLPLAYEVLAGNTADSTTLPMFLDKIQKLYGSARRVWVMDRGIPTTATLEKMRADGLHYLVGTPKRMLGKLAAALVDKPWAQVHQALKVKLAAQDGELYVLAQSDERRAKERAMRRRRFKALVRGLHALRKRLPQRDALIGQVAVLRKEAGLTAGLVEVHLPAPQEAVTPTTFHYHLSKSKYQEALQREGSYLLRTNLTQGTGVSLWAMYMQLVAVEDAFRCLKSDLGLRPIWHQVQPRVEAHILVAFLSYCLTATLKKKLEAYAPGLTPKAVLEQLAAIQLVDVCLPTADGRQLVMPRYTEPQPEQAALLAQLKLSLPQQPPPRIKDGEIVSAKRP